LKNDRSPFGFVLLQRIHGQGQQEGRCGMPTRNVNLTDELDRFVLAKVASGQFESASEVVRTALRSLDREEHMYEAKLAALRNAIDEGDSSGLARGDVFARVRGKLKLEKRRG